MSICWSHRFGSGSKAMPSLRTMHKKATDRAGMSFRNPQAGLGRPGKA